MNYAGLINGNGGAYAVKAPTSGQTFSFDYTDWLNGETLSASIWTLGSGIAQSGAVFTTSSASVLITGGTTATDYTVTNAVTASPSGRTTATTFTLRVRSDASIAADVDMASLLGRVGTSEIEKRVTHRATGCPGAIVRNAVAEYARDFFERSGVWTATVSGGVYVDDVLRYAIDVPADAFVVAVEWVKVATREMSQEAYDASDRTGIRFYNAAGNAGDAITAKVMFSTTGAAGQLPSIAARYVQAIADGACGELLMQPNKTWTNPELALFLKEKADHAAGIAQVSKDHAGQVSAVVAQPRAFGRNR